jgi:hypothetical protein
MMIKRCDNCATELSRFSFLKNRKIYRFNNVILCLDCFTKISQRKHVEEKA